MHYRDFSCFLKKTQAPVELEVLRKGFNEINSTFKALSKEKGSQFQNLQQVIAIAHPFYLEKASFKTLLSATGFDYAAARHHLRWL